MKLQRYRRVQRILKFYRINYGFHKPFRILVDGTFCNAALENHINLREQLPVYLGEEMKILTTPCVLDELRLMGPRFSGALKIAEQYIVEKCGHRTAISAANCICEIVRSATEQKFFIGTQDSGLTEKLRKIPGCPVMFIKYKTLLIEKPSDSSQSSVAAAIEHKLHGASVEVNKVKRKLLGDPVKPMEEVRRFKMKGPNPLSCKKKKKKKRSGGPISNNTVKQKRKSRHQRSRKKVATNRENVAVGSE